MSILEYFLTKIEFSLNYRKLATLPIKTYIRKSKINSAKKFGGNSFLLLFRNLFCAPSSGISHVISLPTMLYNLEKTRMCDISHVSQNWKNSKNIFIFIFAFAYSKWGSNFDHVRVTAAGGEKTIIPFLRRGNERNYKCPLWTLKEKAIYHLNCMHNWCNCNGVFSGMAAQCCHQSHICTENLIPKITLHLWAYFLTCSQLMAVDQHQNLFINYGVQSVSIEMIEAVVVPPVIAWTDFQWLFSELQNDFIPLTRSHYCPFPR